ncbi:MAG: MAE_28990/MAE_18760 family HEPN-like nuclease [Erysipelotrichaceae bacterium]|nr:MAE_28990/MAE_18760 family HEPN-like nuclease [Erysipelotrichaceae bacterium]
MKIRNQGDFLELLERDLTWRKRELSRYSLQTKSLGGQDLALILKTGIALLYAHWEGYVKFSSRLYFQYLRTLGGSIAGYAENVVAVCLYKTYITQDHKLPFYQFYEVMRKARNPDIEFHSSIEEAITAKSNLKYEVLLEILTMLNISAVPYELKKQLIDHKLCHLRNAFCHGDRIDVDMDDFELLQSMVVELLESFKADLSNLVSTSAYLTPGSVKQD